MAQQEFKPGVFWVEFDGAARAAQFVRNTVDLKIFKDKFILSRPIEATPNGVRPSDQFRDSKRLP